MATKLWDLIVTKVDLVPEGAKARAFVTLFKRKELSMDVSEILQKMKPEHREVLETLLKEKDTELSSQAEALDALQKQYDEASESLTKATEQVAQLEKEVAEAEKTKGETIPGVDEDEQLLKSLDPAVREYVEKMNAQKTAAEELAKTLAKEKLHEQAVAKAAVLKSIPVEMDELVAFIEKSAPEDIAILEKAAAAIDEAVLGSVGTSGQSSFSKSATSAWDAIEKKARAIASEQGITVEKACAQVIELEPELYKEYLDGGAN